MEQFDFSYLNKAFKPALEPKLPSTDIRPIPDKRCVNTAHLGEEENESLAQIGLKAIAEGRVAAVVLAGGQVSRLGSAQPKGVLGLGTGLGQDDVDLLLFIQAAQIVRFQRMAAEQFPAEAAKSGGRITWLVMTSNTTNGAVHEHLNAVLAETTGLIPDQVLIFTQKEIPAFDFDGNALMKSSTELVTALDGNGGFYDVVRPLLPELEKRGVQHLYIYCVDNILCRVADPAMIGCAIDRQADCALKLKVHSNYKAADFDEDIRHVLRRAGCKNEKICFIMDESNMMDTGFLERLNTLLTNGEVPGLFEGDDFNTLLSQIKEGAQSQGIMLDSSEELYKWFTAQIVQNLHVVFTMNPSGDGLRERASTSPALFNRCVLDWFGDWSNSALFQVGHELTSMCESDKSDYTPPAALDHCCDRLPTEIAYRDAVVNSFVHIHNIVRKTNVAESRKGHRVMAITPRHFLDMINHFVMISKEKRDELADEQIHLNNGLREINETEQQVKELQKSLNEKEVDLRKKQGEANAKSQLMLGDQREAENEKRTSETLQKQIREEKQCIDRKKNEVERELAEVKPAVEEAKSAVSGIKRAQLVEVRSMASPPNAVKIAMEVICLLLGEKQTEWKSIRAIMVKDDFIPRILQFNTDSITPEITEKMKQYEDNPDWEFEKVNRASVACGPIVKWARAQLFYAKMLIKIEPLNSELKRLEKDAEEKTVKGEELKHKIEALENRIQELKDEYAQLIGEAKHIKRDLQVVQEKVNRSIHMLKSLRVECDRWKAGKERFAQQNETLVGDVLLSAAFLSYSGYYDQLLRDTLFQKWMGILESSQIMFRHELAHIEYLSTADERLQWNNNGMPNDELCTENAIMLKRFNRFPLIIDPSGQSIEFICKEFSTASGKEHQKGGSVQLTSFNDNLFRENLESALRFGQTLLVQDAESYDPILNPVLNREVKRTGGRVLITIGDKDIDLSPDFKIFLFTRDSSVEFPADVCSRVTFVNFTTTRASLETQCLHQVLHSERPDIDKKRNDLLKLQGEFAVRLRHLEKALLIALNKSKGKILDDDSVIATLEKLKNQAQEVAKKSAETMNRRWICNDVWMDIFPSFDYAQLGLKMALLSPRFDALVDKHFDGKSELTIWRRIEIRKDKGPEPKLLVQMHDKFVPFPLPDRPLPLPDRPLPSKIRFKRLQIVYIDHSVIAFLRSNHQIFDKRGPDLNLWIPTDVQPIWDIFVREIWPIFSPNVRQLRFFDGDHLDKLLRLTSPTILTDLLNLNSIDSSELFPAAIGDDFDVQNATISAGQALTKWLHSPAKDGQPKRLRCIDYNGQTNFDWINNFKEQFLRANAISSVSYEIRLFVYASLMEIVPFELVNERTQEKLTLTKQRNWYTVCTMKRCKFGEAVAVQQHAAIYWQDENWDNNCNNVSVWLLDGTNCIGPLSPPPEEVEEEAGQCITNGPSSDNE
ncbi:hypothetical protein niasHT_003499 [Heterodera trifolii]|uniref:Dynein heavy chain n=1 Tax=Heterodera trifolii TaxID=157864 RepID=A0ABD2LVD7_9BILA